MAMSGFVPKHFVLFSGKIWLNSHFPNAFTFFFQTDLLSRSWPKMDSGGTRPSQVFDLRPEDELRFEAGSSSIRIEACYYAVI